MLNKLITLVGTKSDCIPEQPDPGEPFKTLWDFDVAFAYSNELFHTPSDLGRAHGISAVRWDQSIPPELEPILPGEPQIGMGDKDVIQVTTDPLKDPAYIRIGLVEGLSDGLQVSNLNRLAHPHNRTTEVQFHLSWFAHGKQFPTMDIFRFNFDKEGSRYLAVRMVNTGIPNSGTLQLINTTVKGLENMVETVNTPYIDNDWPAKWTFFIRSNGEWGVYAPVKIGHPALTPYIGFPVEPEAKVCKGNTMDLLKCPAQAPLDVTEQMTELNVHGFYVDVTP